MRSRIINHPFRFYILFTITFCTFLLIVEIKRGNFYYFYYLPVEERENEVNNNNNIDNTKTIINKNEEIIEEEEEEEEEKEVMKVTKEEIINENEEITEEEEEEKNMKNEAMKKRVEEKKKKKDGKNTPKRGKNEEKSLQQNNKNLSKSLEKEKNKEKEIKLFSENLSFCDGENMAYNISYYSGDVNNNNSSYFIIKGKKFDCSLLLKLKYFNLTDKWNTVINENNYYYNKNENKQLIADPSNESFNNTPFILAANLKFYPSLRAIINEIRSYFFKQVQIIVFDLGGILENTNFKTELNSLCNLQVRKFNFSQLPQRLHNLKTFSWKILIFAEIFNEFNSFIYCDTSIKFNTNDYKIFFREINRNMLGDFQFTMGTHHGLKYATHPDMFNYIPLDPTLTIGSKIGEDTNDIEMMEANMIIIRKSDYTRQLLKWSLLCALTPECIEPIGAKLSCQDYLNDQLFQDGRCHRQDQSLMNILLHNMELKLTREGSKITPHLRYNHPSKWGNRHNLMRKQKTNVNIVQLFGKNNINGTC